MRRRKFLAVGSGLAAAGTGSVEAVKQELAKRGDVAFQDGTVTVRIVETNAPVQGGALLEVTIELENTGDEAVRAEVASFYEGEPRSTIRTTVEAGETETFEDFSYRTYPVERDDEVTVRFETATDVDERTVAVRAVDELDAGRTSPAREVSVQPGTSILFEVESDALGEYGGRTRWFVDGEYDGQSMGPWYSAYYGHQGADHWRATFESPGTREVTAAVGDEERYRTSWTVEVAETGIGAPTIEGQRPADESLTVVRDEPTELELDVAHPDGALDRVVWWLSQSDVLLGVSEVSGTEATASIELEGGCHTCSIVTWVIDEYGTVTAERPWVIDEIEDGDAALGVTITGTNEPVDAGETLDVTAAVENATDSELTTDVDLIVGHDPERVDGRSVTVPGGETETVDLEFSTATVRRTQTFPVRVETDESADERTVTVIGTEDIGLDVAIAETNAPVRTGEFLEVTAEFANGHDSTLTREAQLVVGHDPDVVETATVTLDPGESETRTMGYETALVENDQRFPVRVETEGGADEVPVFVYVDGPPLLVRILETNDPVTTGGVLEVTAELENAAESATEQDVELVVGHDPERVDSETVTVDGEDRETVTLEFETAMVRRTQVFPVRVACDDDAAVRDVEVIGTEDVDVTISIIETNDPVDAGDELTVTAAIENAGDVEVTQDLEFVVGHDPTVVDTAFERIAPGTTETVEMGFETALVENDQEFPVRVESAVAGDERSVLVYGTDGDDGADGETELAVVDYQILGSDPGEEYVTIRNTGDETIDMSGWTMEDDGLVPANRLNPFGFPPGFTLQPGAEVTIITGNGENTTDTLYWDVDRQVWSEEGDIVRIIDDDGEVVLEESIAAGSVRTSEASLIVSDQVGDGETLVIDEATADEDFFLEAQYASETTQSGVFEAGTTVESYELELAPPLEDDATVDVYLRVSDGGETLASESIAYGLEESEPATFEISNLDAPGSVEAGDALEVTAQLSNVGDESGETAVQLAFDQQSVDSQSVSLAAGDTVTVTLTHQTAQGDVGDRTATVTTDDDSASLGIRVTEPEPAETADEEEPVEEETPDGGESDQAPEDPAEGGPAEEPPEDPSDPPGQPPEDPPEPPQEPPEEPEEPSDGTDDEPAEEPSDDSPEPPADGAADSSSGSGGDSSEESAAE